MNMGYIAETGRRRGWDGDVGDQGSVVRAFVVTFAIRVNETCI